jgi:hypothetical protein
MNHASPAPMPEKGINYGVDFERARERLSHVAGQAFRRYIQLKRDPLALAQARMAARQTYIAAQQRYENLGLHQSAEIARLLSDVR